MTALRIFLARVKALFRGRAMDEALRREVADHLDEATSDFVRRGLSPDEARRAALVRFGGVTQTEQNHRERRGFASLDRLRLDGRLTLRALRRTPGFTVTVILVSAIGIGSITAVFALLYAIVLRPLPFAQPDELGLLSHTERAGHRELGMSPGLAVYYASHVPSIAAMALYDEGSPQTVRLPNGDVARARLMFASHRLFDILGTVPARGRLFTAEDGKPGFMDATWAVPILLDFDFWRDRFGSDQTVVGRTLIFGRRTPRLVVGVLPEGFRFPDTASDVWELEEPPPFPDAAFDSFGWNALVKLKPGMAPAVAQAQAARALPQIVGTYADATSDRVATLAPNLIALKDAVSGDVSRLLWTLLGGMICLLLIACANVASLLASRLDGRRGEIAVRQAIGAGPGDVARLFVVEAGAIAVASGALGILAARALVRAVLTLTPMALPRSTDIRVGPAAAAFAALVAIAITVFYAAFAVRSQRASAITVGSGARSTQAKRGTGRIRDPFTVVQVGLALSLLVGSALMIQTFQHLSNRALGFSPRGALTVELTIPGSQSSVYARMYQAAVDRVGTIPGIESAAAGSFVPLAGGGDLYPVVSGDRPVSVKFVTRGYFETMNQPVVEGFGLGRGEPITVERPVIVSQTLARRLFPGQSAVGQPIRRLNRNGTVVTMAGGATPPFTIAGVVADVPEVSLRAGGAEAMYIPVIEPHVEPSSVPTEMTLVVRTSRPPAALTSEIRKAISQADPIMTVGRIRTMTAIVDAARGTEVFVGSLLLLAATISLLLSVVGIYGSVTQVVRRRRREIGVRLALGAQRRQVVGMVAAGSMRSVAVGLAGGVMIALAGTNALRALLFEVGPRDPMSFVAATAVLFISAATAATLAGRRAAHITPTEALRDSG